MKKKLIDQIIKKFIKSYGLNDTDMISILENIGYVIEDNDFSELAINEGYVWLEKYNTWINKNNPAYTESDNKIYQTLYEEKFKLV